jgi:hypothetical protein
MFDAALLNLPPNSPDAQIFYQLANSSNHIASSPALSPSPGGNYCACSFQWTRSYCYRKWIRFIARLLYWFDAWYGGGRCPAPGKKCSTREQWMPQWEDKLWLGDCFFRGFRVVFQYLFTLVHVGIPSYLSMLYIYIYI